jgi:hypothetical protein
MFFLEQFVYNNEFREFDFLRGSFPKVGLLNQRLPGYLTYFM